jgi:hypothetical protein
MSTYGTQQAAPDFHQTRLAVALHTAIVFVATFGVQSFLVGPLPVLLPSVIICIAVGLTGLFIAALEAAQAGARSPAGGSPGPGGTPPGAGPVIGLILVVIAIILGAFFYSHGNKSQALGIAAGVASALAWGLSIVGALIWSHFVFSSIYWGSWFNLFAAVFAALAVGYMS